MTLTPQPGQLSHNLPGQLTPFVGRSRELAEITDLLTDPGCRLLTLFSPGGTGKTRLAIQAGGKFLAGYPGGVYFVPLQPLESPELLLPAIADTLNFSLAGSQNLPVQLAHFLNDKRLLLILDNMMAYVGQTPMDGEQTWLEMVGPEPVRARAIQLHQLDPVVLEPLLAGTVLNGAEPDRLLTQIRCPAHLLSALVALPLQDVERAVAHMPHCTHTVVENAGHDIHLDQPEAFIQKLMWFLTMI
jgi:pimeloyl-ACP methyl ester carboxylesterase